MPSNSFFIRNMCDEKLKQAMIYSRVFSEGFK